VDEVVGTHRRHAAGNHGPMPPQPPQSTKTNLAHYLRARARTRWPVLVDLTIRHHGRFAYVAGQLTDGTVLAYAACATPGTPATGASPSTAPATTTTKTASCPQASPPEPPKKPSTPHAASTSTIPPPGPTPDELTGGSTTVCSTGSAALPEGSAP
jgi:hypothetical protein